MQKDNFVLLNRISQAIYDKKGSNILALDVRPCHIMADYAIIADGSVDKHVIAIAYAIEKVMAEEGHHSSFTQGMQIGDWIVLDYMDIVVHLFLPDVRDRYQLERLWQKSEIVDVVIEVHEKRCLII